MATLSAIQYVTHTVDDLGSEVFISELVPAQAQPGDTFICVMDNCTYQVGEHIAETGSGETLVPAHWAEKSVTVAGKSYRSLTKGSAAAALVSNSWSGSVPSNGATSAGGHYPDASYFAVGPWAKDENGGSVTPYYAWVLANGNLKVVSATSLTPQSDYTAIALANKTVAAVAAGASPTSTYSVANLFAAVAEVNVSAIDSYSTDQKTDLLKFYGVLDSDSKLTVSGASLATRLKANATAEPSANKYSVGNDGTVTAATAWSSGTYAQPVEYSTGANWSTGFLPGRS